MTIRRVLFKTLRQWLWALAVGMLAASATANAQTGSSRTALADSVKAARQRGDYAWALAKATELLEVTRNDSLARVCEVTDAELLLRTMERATRLPEAQQHRLTEAGKMNARVEGLITAGRYAEADTLCRGAVAIYEGIFGPDDPEVLESLNNLAALYYYQGQYRQATALFKRILVIQEKALGPDHPNVARTLNDLATQYGTLGEFEESERQFGRALAIREKTLGPDHPDVAETLANLAYTYRQLGQYSQAEPLARRALAIREKALGPDNPEVARNLNFIALLYSSRGLYAQAEPLFKRSVTIWEKALGPDHSEMAAPLNNLSNLYYMRGQYAQAAPLLERSLTILEKALGPDHYEVSVCLSNLAEQNRIRGQYTQAEQLYKRALAIHEKVLGSDHPAIAQVLQNLAVMHRDQGQYLWAEPLFKRSLAIYEKVFGPDHPKVAKCLDNTAEMYRIQGQYAQAEPLFKRSLAIYEKVFGPEHPDAIRSLNRLARMYLAVDESATAVSSLQEASRMFESARLRAGSGLDRATFQDSPYPMLAAAYLADHQAAKAWPAVERDLGRVLAEVLFASRQRQLAPPETAREDSLRRALTVLEGKMGEYIKAAHRDTTGAAAKKAAEAHVQLLAAEVEWSRFTQEISEKYPLAEGQAYSLERVQATLGKKTALIGWLDISAKQDSLMSWAYVIRHSGTVTWIDLNAAAGDRRSDAGVGTAPFRLERLAELCRRGLADPLASSSMPRLVDAAVEFSAVRTHPLLPMLEGVDNLILIPSGVMAYIPAEALVDGQGHYLGDRFTISYTPSATIYVWLQEERQGREKGNSVPRTLLLGDPPFTQDQKTAMELEQAPLVATNTALVDTLALRDVLTGDEEALAALPRLPGTRAEIQALSAVCPQPTVLLGSDASEEELVRLAQSGELRTFSTLHMATHALVDGERPERSCLILSRVDLPDALEAAEQGERIYDGQLTVQEILQEWKLDADLVTLSACETGLGKQIGGEGMVGFAHAFLQAGARSLVVSLWKVDDRATSLLMTRFYKNMNKRGMQKAEALREAKRWLRDYRDEEGRRPYDHPCFWSAFVLIGERK